MRRQTSIIFYLLSIYVILQFAWWSYLLIDLSEKFDPEQGLLQKRVVMVLGEGLVFFVILIFGLYKIFSSIKKELALSNQQQNFILSITHELKTPLAAVKLYLQTIQKRELDRVQQTDLLVKALEENTRLENLVENVLTVARIENKAYVFCKEKTDVNVFVRELVARYEIFENVQFVLNICNDFQTEIDQASMHLILSNLVDNAIKYAGKNPIIQLSVNRLSDRVEWIVEDNGPGIDKSKIREIFAKFVRLENEETRKTKGTGLGLYIVEQFVLKQNGKIKLSASTLGGAKFTITL